MSARDCADIRTRDGPRKSARLLPAPNVFTREDTGRGGVRYPGLSMGLELGSGRRDRCDGVVSRKRIESERGSTAANDFACLTPAGNARSASAKRTALLFPRRPPGPESRLIRAD